jgi:hypothetical protein
MIKMKFLNHYKMGRLIWEKMATNDMVLRKRLYFLGNLAPDLIGSFLFKQHSYSSCGANLRKLLRQLIEGNVSKGGIRFSFYSGIISHYICDFLCYAHTEAFKGSVREHYLYEKNQTVKADEVAPFIKHQRINYSYIGLKFDIENCIINHEKALSQNADLSIADITLAIYVATWAASALYLQCDRINEPETMTPALLSA